VNRELVAKVSRFSDGLQTATRTMETEVDVDNPRGDLAPGMFADAVLTLDRHERALAIPIQAVTGAEDTATLLIVDAQGRVAQKEVKLGLETADKREVLSGLSEGDLVVVGKAAALHPGDQVHPQESK
jgi:multidrug efflux pump subunit AcrA (membrane-fusion protein)